MDNTMNLRQEAEQLALIYIPAYGAILILQLLMTHFMGEAIESQSFSSFNFMSWLPITIAGIPSVAISIWLFFRAKSNGYNPYLWALFGLFGKLFAAAIFCLVRVYDGSHLTRSPSKDAQSAPLS
jgi:hypothetical protein